ncbi:MAG: chloride channel protein [Cruoricaptor ignavus]|nr:chloride channel protein [Cruoricaptor ignavus]
MNINYRFFISLAVIGVIAGLVGFALTELLHFVQHQAFGYSTNGENIPFRIGVENATPERRLIVLVVCGLVVGLGWYFLHKFGSQLVDIKKSLLNPQKGLPFSTTILHSLLQIITVGLGSPLGREVAPREMSAAFASLWIKKMKLNTEDAKLLIACASGAGLAAVYNVPAAAVIFIIETLVCVINIRVVFSALFVSCLATIVSRYMLGDLVQYHLTDFSVNTPILWFSVFMGIATAFVVKAFRSCTTLFPFWQRTDKRMIILAVLAFACIGFLSMYYPDILGNGKAGNQLAFMGLMDYKESLVLLFVKWLAVLLALAAGAYGGLITPSMMLGSTLALSVAFVWNYFLPPISTETAALIGATVFLALSLKMPLTAIIFALELTRSSGEILFPLVLAVSGGLFIEKFFLTKIKSQPQP